MDILNAQAEDFEFLAVQICPDLSIEYIQPIVTSLEVMAQYNNKRAKHKKCSDATNTQAHSLS